MFQLSRVPQTMEHWQNYIDLVKHDEDENAFLVFLHYYEPTINGKVESFVNRYGLHGHFADVKMAYVEALWERLRAYPPDWKAGNDGCHEFLCGAESERLFHFSGQAVLPAPHRSIYLQNYLPGGSGTGGSHDLRSAPCDGENRKAAVR